MELLLGQLLALATAFCWAQNSLIYTHVGRKLSSFSTAHIRLWIALPLILVVHLLFEGSLLPHVGALWPLAILGTSGFLGFFVADILIFSSFVSLGARPTMVVMTTSPIVGALLSWVLQGETLTSLQFAGIVITLAGVAWVVLAGARKGTGTHTSKDSETGAGTGLGNEGQPKTERGYARGIAAAAGGSVTQALALVLAKYGMTTYAVTPVSATTIRIIAGLAGIALFSLLTGRLVADFKKFSGKTGSHAFGLVALAAAAGPVLGIILNLTALNLAPVGVVSTLSQTTPVILIPIEICVLHQTVPRSAIYGTTMAILGTTLLFL